MSPRVLGRVRQRPCVAFGVGSVRPMKWASSFSTTRTTDHDIGLLDVLGMHGMQYNVSRTNFRCPDLVLVVFHFGEGYLYILH